MGYKQKRPVYVVQRDTGMRDEEGKKIVVLIAIKQTRVGADIEASLHEGAVVVDKFLTD